MVANPPMLPAVIPIHPAYNCPESFSFRDDLGGWEDKPYTPAPTHTRRARVRVYVSILPYSQKNKCILRLQGFGYAVVREGGLLAGRIA